MNPKAKIENLIFDIGGVIVLSKKIDFTKFDKKWSLPNGTVKKIVDICFKKMSLDKNFNLREYFKKNFSHLLSFEQYQKITNLLFQNERINKTLVSWIHRKRKKYITCLLTNNTAILKRLLKKRFKIFDDFDYIFNSADIGLSKPNPKFFKYVLKILQTTPQKCLFIDNNSINVEVAKNLGFNAILFTTNKEFFEKISKFNLNENSQF
jgi:epoxide hydrolase-like predicted phosphatase